MVSSRKKGSTAFMDLPIILFEDNHCIAVLKPAPLLTQGVPPGIPTLEAMVKEYLKEKFTRRAMSILASPIGWIGRFRASLSSRNTKAAAPSRGAISAAAGEKNLLGRGRRQCAAGGRPLGGLAAQDRRGSTNRAGLRGHAGSASRHFALIVVWPTMRTPPCWRSFPRPAECTRFGCRRRFAAGPSVAMSWYGARLPFGPPAEFPRDRTIALHARELTFLHPIRYEPITLTAPLPDSLRRAWLAFGSLTHLIRSLLKAPPLSTLACMRAARNSSLAFGNTRLYNSSIRLYLILPMVRRQPNDINAIGPGSKRFQTLIGPDRRIDRDRLRSPRAGAIHEPGINMCVFPRTVGNTLQAFVEEVLLPRSLKVTRNGVGAGFDPSELLDAIGSSPGKDAFCADLRFQIALYRASHRCYCDERQTGMLRGNLVRALSCGLRPTSTHLLLRRSGTNGSRIAT